MLKTPKHPRELNQWAEHMVEIAPELTGHGFTLSKCKAHNRV
jgi:hypothetical protein